MAKSKTLFSTATSSAASTSSSKPFAWPPILSPAAPLSSDEITPSILVIDDLLTVQSLNQWRAFLPSIPLLPSPPQKRGEAYRTNDRFSRDDPEFARQLWERSGLRELCERELRSVEKGKTPMGLSPNIRLYRYNQEAEFGPHYDDDTVDSRTGWRSEWTLLIYLTGVEDGVVGGETTFYPAPRRKAIGEELKVELKRGRALLHRHGRDCMLHSGLKVQKGVKWVLRSDVLFG